MPDEKTKPIVLVTHFSTPKSGINLLKCECEVKIIKCLPVEHSVLLKECVGVNAILWATGDKLNNEILEAAGPQLKVVSTMSTGINNVDVEEFKNRQIALGYAPKVTADAVSDVAVGLLIAAGRRFGEGRLKIETNQWQIVSPQQWLLGCDIRGATAGFFGYGAIGQSIARRLIGFNIGKIIYHQRNRSLSEADFKSTFVDFDQLLQESDFIFVACPSTSETRHKFDYAAFCKMKRSCVFVNISRGDIVVQDDLIKALKCNRIFAAGLDVCTPEPLPPKHPLLKIPNCVITPHIGSATKRTRDDMSIVAAHNILRGLAGEPLLYSAI